MNFVKNCFDEVATLLSPKVVAITSISTLVCYFIFLVFSSKFTTFTDHLLAASLLTFFTLSLLIGFVMLIAGFIDAFIHFFITTDKKGKDDENK